jgi:hypothetical protein
VTRIGDVGPTYTANVVPSAPILVTPMTEVISSFETSVLTGATRRNISEDANLHSHRREKFKLYKIKSVAVRGSGGIYDCEP